MVTVKEFYWSWDFKSGLGVWKVLFWQSAENYEAVRNEVRNVRWWCSDVGHGEGGGSGQDLLLALLQRVPQPRLPQEEGGAQGHLAAGLLQVLFIVSDFQQSFTKCFLIYSLFDYDKSGTICVQKFRQILKTKLVSDGDINEMIEGDSRHFLHP